MVHVGQLKMARATDEEIIERAKTDDRAVLTEGLDFGAILAVTGEVEPGVIILRVGNWTRRQIDHRLERVLGQLPEESFKNAIVVVDRQRVRIRKLPVHRREPI
ncbi:MAG: DUF5615 family PIN-like protein [Chloroflexi bacterium]|nr:DUF5615 family PIN-like protein [Chloroflexota bacterium]